jgi:acyl-CoA hydrolase
VSPNTRAVVNSEAGDYVPVFLSQIPQLFKKAILPIDVALIQVSPPMRTAIARWALRWMWPVQRWKQPNT